MCIRDGYRLVARCTVDRVAAGVGGGRGLIRRLVQIGLDVTVVTRTE